MKDKNRVCQLFGIQYPIIQGGMVWHSGWRLASAVSNTGGLGLIGAGSMYPDVLKEHIQKCKKATDKPFGVNVPMLYPDLEELLQVIITGGVKIIFTSAGNPKPYTEYLKKEGLTVAHVVSSAKFAIKCQEAGVEAVVAEGFEAGGHNGREETTTFCLLPEVRKTVNLPLIAAGGIALGSQIKAAMALGAEGVQMGTRFAATHESSAHISWKNRITELKEGDTLLTLKELAPVRLVKNNFFYSIEEIYRKERSLEKLKEALGRGKAKKGMFLGDLEHGELEIGQVSSLIDKVLSVEEVFAQLLKEYDKTKIEDL
ncbi:MAG: nitronate monooxygenase [Bergeyella sp.]|nr:nitronate monooxygenase [Bergeyella sp.]